MAVKAKPPKRKVPKPKPDLTEGISEALIENVADRIYDSPIDYDQIDKDIQEKKTNLVKLEQKKKKTTVKDDSVKHSIYLPKAVWKKFNSIIYNNKLNQIQPNSINSITVEACLEYLEKREKK